MSKTSLDPSMEFQLKKLFIECLNGGDHLLKFETVKLAGGKAVIEIPTGVVEYDVFLTPLNHGSSSIVETAWWIGSGLDDLTAGGTYTGASDAIFTVEIDRDATSPESFKWRKDGGAYTENVDCDTSPIPLQDGVTVTFKSITGHTNGDRWIIPVKTSGRYIVNKGGTGTFKIISSNSSDTSEIAYIILGK